MNLVNAILAESETLPPLTALGYEYVVAGNGLFIRAEDSRLAALVPIADDLTLHGLVALEPSVEFKLPRVPEAYLLAVWQSARRHLPNEAMYQLLCDDKRWRIVMPRDIASPTPISLDFDDDSNTVIDLHSHARTEAFFSPTDDSDERGLRGYCVVGKVDTEQPEVLCRVGVYGHHLLIAADTLFESLGPFRDVYDDVVQERLAERNEPSRDIFNGAPESNIAQTESGWRVARF